MPLKDYRDKRNFKATNEPAGKKSSAHKGDLEFVVQEHHASHLHYDFRLEVNGVLKSWAIPKGPSLDPSIKRLAIHVEDHPFEYRKFEGTIPEGQYGAGKVKIWDKGTYYAEGAKDRNDTEHFIEKGLKQGRINFFLEGKKLRGIFSLIQLKGDKANQWLFIKKKDDFAKKENVSSPSSTGKADQITLNKPHHQSRELKDPMPSLIKPMLATLIDDPFDDKDWIFEIKWDGYRALAEIKKGSIHLYSRNLQLFDKRYPILIDDLRSIQIPALLDGEIVVLDEDGQASFQMLQNYPRDQKGSLIYYVFDLLYVEGIDLRNTSLIQRKKILKKLITKIPNVRFCEHVKEKGKLFFKAAVKEGLEGIIGKKGSSLYLSGRSVDWVKIKTHQRQEAIICGFTPPKNGREKFGSLLLGLYEGQKLIYIGNTGSGFNTKTLKNVYEKLQPLIQKKSPFLHPQPKIAATWVKPEIVCEVKFAEWTKGGHMRQAIFIGIREDKSPREVIREQTFPSKQVIKEQIPDEKKKSKSISTKKTMKSSELKLTHLDKIYWPEEGYTKGDLIDYYSQVAPLILPYLKNRPETLRRFPNGIEGDSFYQKEMGNVPSWIRTEEIEHEDHSVRYLFIEETNALLYTANLGCIGFHPFNSRFDTLYTPDYLVIDLDPEAIPFEKVIEAAQGVYEVLEELKIPSVCKTSGARGMHIYIPMGARYTFEQVKQFANLLVHLVHERLPDFTSIERSPAKRQKRVYLDYLQNRFAQTVAAPYSVRPLPGATVSTPLKWSEVKTGLNPADFTIKTVLKRFERMGDLFKPALGKGVDLPAILKKMEKK